MSTGTTWQSSYFLEDRNKPLTSNSVRLNDLLKTEHLDVSDEDESFFANVTRTISRFVGAVFTPRQVLGLLRVLKAVTLCFLVLTILSDIMYIIFVEVLASDEVQKLAGGHRDIIIRLYGLCLSLIGLAIELDYSKVVKKFAGLKGFIPRSLLYFFIMQITASHPMMLGNHSYFDYNAYENGNNNNNADDEAAAEEPAYNVVDIQIPSSAVGFQRVTSFMLGICGVGYLICGLLCFDRFTARAFLSNKDPRVTTAIPSSVSNKGGMDGTTIPAGSGLLVNGHNSVQTDGSENRDSHT